MNNCSLYQKHGNLKKPTHVTVSFWSIFSSFFTTKNKFIIQFSKEDINFQHLQKVFEEKCIQTVIDDSSKKFFFLSKQQRDLKNSFYYLLKSKLSDLLLKN